MKLKINVKLLTLLFSIGALGVDGLLNALRIYDGFDDVFFAKAIALAFDSGFVGKKIPAREQQPLDTF